MKIKAYMVAASLAAASAFVGTAYAKGKTYSAPSLKGFQKIGYISGPLCKNNSHITLTYFKNKRGDVVRRYSDSKGTYAWGMATTGKGGRVIKKGLLDRNRDGRLETLVKGKMGFFCPKK